jgi:hypothetical protein
MSVKYGSSQTGSSANSNQRAEPTLPPGSALDLDSIESLARKIESHSEGEVREWAREIAQLAGGLIKQYQQTAQRWAVNQRTEMNDQEKDHNLIRRTERLQLFVLLKGALLGNPIKSGAKGNNPPGTGQLFIP